MAATFLSVPGRWVQFIEPDPDTERVPEGFYISEERAERFSREPGFLAHRLERVYVMLPPYAGEPPVNEDR